MQAARGTWVALAFATLPAAAAEMQPEAPAARTGATVIAEDIIVTGTRAAQRTALESIAPVEILPAAAVEASISSDFSSVLAQLVPSFNVQRLPLSDGLIFVRPARLRGLSPDHTLLLVNGHRYHRSALLSVFQAPDLASIPTLAIGRVEILRDGASAQYGSDAIAGVINVIFDRQTGFRGFAQTSQYYAGDGTTWQVGVRGGAPLGDGGSLVVTTEFSDGDATSRSRQRPDAIAFQAANPGLRVPDPVQRWGQPELRSIRSAANLLLPLDAFELEGLAIYRTGRGVNDFNWRNPDTTAGVYRNVTAFPGFNFRQVFPAGFTPRFGSKFEDVHLGASLGGDLAPALRAEASVGWGRSIIDYNIRETVNASLGPESPTAFYLGRLGQREFNLGLHLVWRPEIGLAEPLNVAAGFERRVENYRISPGAPASYAIGPGAREGLAPNANGFPGFSDLQAGAWSQRSIGAYADVELVPVAWLRLAGALRYEDYSAFGDTFNHRIGARAELAPWLAVRGSWSTGFRAPTPAQLRSTNTSQGLDTRTLQIFTRGRLSPSDPLAIRLGAQPLVPETSDTVAGGVVLAPSARLSATVDAYRINVADRLGESQAFPVPPGVPNPNNFTAVSFFTNDFSTRTTGVDAILAWTGPVGPGNLSASLAYSYTRTKVTSERPTTIPNQTQRILFEERLPMHNATGSATYTLGAMELLVRGRYYGPWTDVTGNATGDIFQRFGSIMLVDVSLTWQPTANLRLTAGAENIFDTYPDEAVFQANRGLIYSRNAPFDTDGGQWYVRLGLDF